MNPFSDLHNTGKQILRNLTLEECLNISSKLGSIIAMTDIKVNPQFTEMAFSDQAFALHTDTCDAKYVSWFCNQEDPTTPTLVLDTKSLIQKLSPEAYEALFGVPILNRNPDGYFEETILKKVNDQVRIYFAEWLLRFDQLSKTQKHAVTELRNAIENTDAEEVAMNQGDILIIDNHRYLHGRTKVKNPDRHLIRFWIG